MELEVISSDDKVFIANIKKPDFEQFLQALSLLGDMSLYAQIKAGKQIFDFCDEGSDPEFKKNTDLMASLCIHLCAEFVIPKVAEVKKK
jgi:hypothetical protein